VSAWTTWSFESTITLGVPMPGGAMAEAAVL
jgi:hypothetical protein